MPVSSPSYFPPSRGTDQIVGITAGRSQTGFRVFMAGQSTGDNSTASDLVLIGDNVLSAGVTDVNADFTTIIGSQSASDATDFTSGASPGPAAIFGGNILPLVTKLSGTVAIGADICPGLGHIGNGGGNTIIGIEACGQVNAVQVSFQNSVIIGYRAYRCGDALGQQDQNFNVIIGAQAVAAGGSDGFGTITGNVLIGSLAAVSMGGQCSENVFIGDTVASSVTTSANNNVCIGANSNISNNGAIAVTGMVVIGAGASATSSLYATIIGANIGFGGRGVTGTVAIGYGAGTDGGTVPAADQFYLETNYPFVKKTLMFGYLNRGTLIVGNSTGGVNRDISDSQNALKLLAGLPSGVAPVGGGYFYFSAATGLHFISPSGLDTILALP